jgi:hypothetical protein
MKALFRRSFYRMTRIVKAREKSGSKGLDEEPLNAEELMWVRSGESPSFLLKTPKAPTLRNVIRRVDEVEHEVCREISELGKQMQALTALVQEMRDDQKAGK